MGSTSSTLMTDDHDLKKDLTGKVAVITGGNSGIGLQTAKQLSSQGATVIMCSRSLEKANKVIAENKLKNVTPMQLDLASLQSVRDFAEAFLKTQKSLHLLVNNAGVMNPPLKRTTEGFELQMGTNHLGHFLLTELLIPTLKASAPARIVCLSSCAHAGLNGAVAHIDFDDMMYNERKYNGWEAYCQSKLANLLHARELARRYGSDGITAVSVHPGFVESNLLRHTTGDEGSILASVGNVFFKTVGMINPWEGTQASLRAILSDEAKEHNGHFFSQGGSPKDQYPDKEHCKGGWLEPPPNKEGADMKVAQRLWEFSLKAVGLSASPEAKDAKQAPVPEAREEVNADEEDTKEAASEDAVSEVAADSEQAV